MADSAGIPRHRGVLCGLLLVLLGAWGALAPFVGPYFHFAYLSDRTWDYTTGRLYLEILPGAAAALGGLIVMATRSRTAGALAGFLAALGGGWLVVGQAIVAQYVRDSSITAGSPLVSPGLTGNAATQRVLLEGLAFFTGTGLLIVFFAAVALGRFTTPGGAGASWNGQDDEQDSFPASSGQYSTMPGQYPLGAGQSSSDQYGTGTTGTSPAGTADTGTQPGYGNDTYGQGGTAQFPQSSATQTGSATPSAAPTDHFPPQTYPGPSPAGQFPAPAEQPPPENPPNSGHTDF